MENIEILQSEFLTNNKIPSSLIWYFIHKDTNKKIPIGEMSNAKKDNIKTTIDINTKPNGFYDRYNHQYRNLTKEEKDSLKIANSLYLKHSDENIFCADFDDENITSIDDLIKINKDFKIFKKCSYLKGNTKGIHIYFIVDNVPEYKSELEVFNHIKGDLIRRKNNMWERADKKIFGSSKLIRIDFDSLKPLLNDSFFNGKKKIKKTKTIKKTKEGKEEIEEVEEEIIYKDYEQVEITEHDRKFTSLLKPERFYKYNDWREMMWAFKSVGLPFELFDELSSKHGKDKYVSKTDCKAHWDEQTVSKVNIGLIHHYAKRDSPKEYAELNYKFVVEEEKVFPTVQISQRYLLPEYADEEKKIPFTKIDNKNDVFQNQVIKFFNEKIKSLNIRSPYDTGKTQLIKKIINTFNPKKILWLSYRKTLTNDILGSFSVEFNFKDYQKKEFGADRLIIQLESILKLDSIMDIDSNVSEYPSYDLVIIDEIESILKQFDSPTFKGISKECFYFIENVIRNSNKLLTLDGDIGNRTYNFVSSFGDMINVVNSIKINKRYFKISEDKTYYYDQISKDLKNNKNIVIVSMSATACENYKEKITTDFPNKKVLIYTGNSSDKDKEDFKDVLNIWDKCNVLIYSPTCESGVNFDKKHFEKMYGIFAESTTSRQFLQMLARVRKLDKDEIIILNEVFSKHAKPDEFFNFEEVKNSMLLLENVKFTVKNTCVDGKMCRVNSIDTYDINYIYNKVEELNNGKHYYLSMFEMLCANKGHEVEYLNDRPDEKIPDTKKITNTKIILETDDISDDKYVELLEKQKKDDASQEDKFKIKKHTLKKALGLDTIDEDIINTFDVSSVKNFVSLIDEKNVKNSKDNQTAEIKDRAKLINNLIKDLGFKNIFDSSEIDKQTFTKNVENVMEKNILFTNMKNTQVRFSLSKTKTIDSTKGFLGFVNTLLSRYHLKIGVKQVREEIKEEGKKTKKSDVRTSVYKLVELNSINEILEYRILKGYILSDEQNIRPKPTTENYKKFFDWDKYKMNQELMELEEKEFENKMNKYGFGKFLDAL